jgi:hypothetical protein
MISFDHNATSFNECSMPINMSFDKIEDLTESTEMIPGIFYMGTIGNINRWAYINRNGSIISHEEPSKDHRYPLKESLMDRHKKGFMFV